MSDAIRVPVTCHEVMRLREMGHGLDNIEIAERGGHVVELVFDVAGAARFVAFVESLYVHCGICPTEERIAAAVQDQLLELMERGE